MLPSNFRLNIYQYLLSPKFGSLFGYFHASTDGSFLYAPYVDFKNLVYARTDLGFYLPLDILHGMLHIHVLFHVFPLN